MFLFFLCMIILCGGSDQEYDDLEVLESHVNHFLRATTKQNSRSLLRNHIDNNKHGRKEKMFEYTFRKLRPKQPAELIIDLNVQRKNIKRIAKKFEDLKRKKYICRKVFTIKDDQEVPVKDQIKERQNFIRGPPLRRPPAPAILFRPLPPTPVINPSIFIPTVFGEPK